MKVVAIVNIHAYALLYLLLLCNYADETVGDDGVSLALSSPKEVIIFSVYYKQ